MNLTVTALALSALVTAAPDAPDGRGDPPAAISLTASEITDAALLSTVLRHGPVSLVALVRIHWQALKLALMRVPFFPHTPPPAEETSL